MITKQDILILSKLEIEEMSNNIISKDMARCVVDPDSEEAGHFEI